MELAADFLMADGGGERVSGGDRTVMRDIKRKSISEQVAESNLDYTRDAKIQVDDKLPTENEFVERFRVSRTCVREAIKALSLNGILQSIPGRGTFLLKSPSSIGLDSTSILQRAQASILEVMEVRTPLEIKTAELAAVRRAEKDCEELEMFAANYRESYLAGDKNYYVWGREFFDKLIEIVDNPLMTSSLQSLDGIVQRYRESFSKKQGSAEFFLESLDRLCRYIRQMDSKSAGMEMALHMEYTNHLLNEILSVENMDNFLF